MAPYSPILLGVITEAVSEAKHCSYASENVILFSTEANVLHLKISSNQLASVKSNINIKTQILFENTIVNCDLSCGIDKS